MENIGLNFLLSPLTVHGRITPHQVEPLTGQPFSTLLSIQADKCLPYILALLQDDSPRYHFYDGATLRRSLEDEGFVDPVTKQKCLKVFWIAVYEKENHYMGRTETPEEVNNIDRSYFSSSPSDFHSISSLNLPPSHLLTSTLKRVDLSSVFFPQSICAHVDLSALDPLTGKSFFSLIQEKMKEKKPYILAMTSGHLTQNTRQYVFCDALTLRKQVTDMNTEDILFFWISSTYDWEFRYLGRSHDSKEILENVVEPYFDLSSGKKLWKDVAQQMESFALKGDIRIGFELARGYQTWGFQQEENKKTAFEYLMRAGKEAVVYPQNALGICYFYGIGIENDEKTAFEYFQRGANQGIAESFFHLYFCYYEGKIVDRDQDKALEYLKIAADLGFAKAQDLMACQHLPGESGQHKRVWRVPRTFGIMDLIHFNHPTGKEAFTYALLAANQGYLQALIHLSYCYNQGIGVKYDLKKAFDIIHFAATSEITEAFLLLAEFYANGEGVDMNKEEAQKWNELAAKK